MWPSAFYPFLEKISYSKTLASFIICHDIMRRTLLESFLNKSACFAGTGSKTQMMMTVNHKAQQLKSYEITTVLAKLYAK